MPNLLGFRSCDFLVVFNCLNMYALRVCVSVRAQLKTVLRSGRIHAGKGWLLEPCRRRLRLGIDRKNSMHSPCVCYWNGTLLCYCFTSRTSGGTWFIGRGNELLLLAAFTAVSSSFLNNVFPLSKQLHFRGSLGQYEVKFEGKRLWEVALKSAGI